MVKVAYPLASSPIVTPQQWAAPARNWLATGVIKAFLNELQVYADSTGMNVKVKSGAANLLGHYFQSDAEEVLSIAAASTLNPRIDRIIVRLDYTADSIDFAVLQGVPAASPTAPALTQNNTRWEISLSQVLVGKSVSTIAAGNITDERNFVQNANTVIENKQSLVLQNGWLGPAAPYAPVTFRKDPFGFVHLMGRIGGGAYTMGTIIATLPVGYRPRFRMSFPVVTNNTSNDQVGQIDIDTNGNIIGILVYNTYTVLDSIIFPEASVDN